MKKETMVIGLAMVMMTIPTCAALSQVSNSSKSKTLKSYGYAPVNGLKMYYEIHGEGKPVVLLHGAYMTIDLNWNHLIPEISKTRRAIAVEMQGHGHTADIDRPFNYSDLAKDVAALLRYLKIDSVDVIGYSFGGTVAFEMAIQNPILVRKLVILSSTFKYEGWLPQVRNVLRSFQPAFLDNTPLKQGYDAVAPDTAHWYTFVSKFIKFDTKSFDLGGERIKSIRSPVLLVSGDNDGVDLNHIVETYKLVGGGRFGDMEGLPKSQLAIIPAATHVGLMMETEKLVSIINPFLK